MTDKRIREKFHTDGIADKATAIAREKAGGDEALLRAGVSRILIATMEEVYLMGWKDATARTEARKDKAPFPSLPVARDRVVKPLKEGEIDREAMENAKDVGKLDISVLGLSKRVYFKLQERGICTISDLTRAIDKGLKKVRGIGDAAYEEVVRQVRKAEIGLPS